MALKFGTNTIANTGDYAKFGTNNLTTVKFGTTSVWEKQTTLTMQDPEINGWVEFDHAESYLYVVVTNPNNFSVTADIVMLMENSNGMVEDEIIIEIPANTTITNDYMYRMGGDSYFDTNEYMGLQGEGIDWADAYVIFTKTGYQDSATVEWEY